MNVQPSDNASGAPQASGHRRGAVAVIVREERMLIIRRSRTVPAPGAYCFPGGGIEAQETEREALVRELAEELAVRVSPVERLWESVTPWGVQLAWWLAHLPNSETPVPNAAEVESFAWLTIPQMKRLDGLLESNHDFLRALAAGQFSIDGITAQPPSLPPSLAAGDD